MTFEDAKKNCRKDENCVAIWDDTCDGESFYTCRKQKDWDDISRDGSCVWRKNPGKMHGEINAILPSLQNQHFRKMRVHLLRPLGSILYIIYISMFM